MPKELKRREEVKEKLTWDLRGIFESEEKYEKTLGEAKDLAEEIEEEFKENLDSAEKINNCLDT